MIGTFVLVCRHRGNLSDIFRSKNFPLCCVSYIRADRGSAGSCTGTESKIHQTGASTISFSVLHLVLCDGFKWWFILPQPNIKNTVLHVLNEIGVQAVSNSGVASVASVGVRLSEWFTGRKSVLSRFFIPNLHIEASWTLFCISVSDFKPNSDKTLPPSGQTGNYNMSHRWESNVAFCGLICGFSRSFVLLFSVTEDSEEENTQSERWRHKWRRWRCQVGVSVAMSTLAARALCFLTRCFHLN